MSNSANVISKPPQTELDVTELQGIIVNRALANFNMLPPAAKRYIDLEDWISSGVLFVAGDLARRMKYSFDGKRGVSQKTFVYRAVDNFYKNSLALTTNQKRGSAIVSWDDLIGAGTVGQEDHSALRFVNRIDALDKVRRMHSCASRELMVYLDHHFFTQDHPGRVVMRSKKFRQLQHEFLTLANREGVTIDDYRIAILAHQELSVSISRR